MKEAERAKLENNRRLNADGEKIVNDAMIRSLDHSTFPPKIRPLLPSRKYGSFAQK